MARIERIEVTGGEVTFYFDDCPEAFTAEEFIEGSRTHIYLAGMASQVLGFNAAGEINPWQRDWQSVREVK
jgi:predicted ATP-grasp superfamily ATP-dependent carboligase